MSSGLVIVPFVIGIVRESAILGALAPFVSGRIVALSAAKDEPHPDERRNPEQRPCDIAECHAPSLVIGSPGAVGNLAGIAGPAITGFLVDRTGSFYSAFALAIGVSIAAA